METIYTIKNGFGCDAGGLPNGWFVGALLLQDSDAEFLSELGRHSVTFREKKDEAAWSHAVVSSKRKLVLVSSADGKIEERDLAEAERITGFACCGGEKPALVWTEFSGGVWRLVVWTSGEQRVLFESERMLRSPSAAMVGDRMWVACETTENGRSMVAVWTDGNTSPISIEGRRPKLVGSNAGQAFLMVERSTRLNGHLLAYRLNSRGAMKPIPVPRMGDYNFNAHLACHPSDGSLYAVYEVCPRWGMDERVGLHRDMALMGLAPAADRFEAGPDTEDGILKLQRTAFKDGGVQNLTTIYPRVFWLDNEPAVAFRQFRFVGTKSYGWDTYLMLHSRGSWAIPERISEHPGPPDAGYAVLSRGEEVLCFLPCCDHIPVRSFAEEANGLPGRPTQAARKHRIEILRFRKDESLFPVTIPADKQAAYIPQEIAPDPPVMAIPGETLSLIWGDLHAHSAYSKCMSVNDGSPRDVLRFQRDVLGCRVLCLTEHVEYMTQPEFTHVLDCLEEEAGDGCIPLYAVEWAKRPAHHTNFYAMDRGVFERLRALMLVSDHLTTLYERIKRELPPGSVTAIRHMHGINQDEYGVSGPRVTETHDPELEWAMEAMQTRGNMMVAAYPSWPPFPNNFLNKGAKIGLVGGSDHSRGQGSNRFCLTGFWVHEVSSSGVFQAIRERKTIAASNAKIAVYAMLDGRAMGEGLEVSGSVRITCRLSSAKEIHRVCLMRDGRLLRWTDVGVTEATVQLVDEDVAPGAHWYVVTVDATLVEPEPALYSPTDLVHASPFFVNVG
jgi:hypothetical protein